MNRHLIGMLTPSSNTVLEPYTSAMLLPLFPHITAHFQRFVVREISLDKEALAQFQTQQLVDAAVVLNDAQVDVLAWCGTSASWLGFDTDERLCTAITETTGVPATTSVLALNEALRRTNVGRLGLVTPYLEDVQRTIIKNYNAAGHEVVAERHLGDKGNFSFSDYDEATLERLIREVAESQPEAITVLCTNFRGTGLVDRLEKELNIPIYDSISVTLWRALELANVDTNIIKGWGQIFSLKQNSKIT